MLTLARGWRDLTLSEADRAMLAYVEVLALTPSKATAEHVAALRQAGFRDEEIFEIVMVTAYYALRCRMADGLGVEVDPRARQDSGLVEAFAYRAATGHE
ncbi:MAG: carboxymuconolactone decarboxylase family protein [Candidatus Rokuibacteriota bacterium]